MKEKPQLWLTTNFVAVSRQKSLGLQYGTVQTSSLTGTLAITYTYCYRYRWNFKNKDVQLHNLFYNLSELAQLR